MSKKENNNKNNLDKQSDNDEIANVLNVKEQFLKEKNINLEITQVLNDQIIEISNKNSNKELESIYKNKIKELEEKIKEYNERYLKLESAIQSYEDKNQNLLNKRVEYEETINQSNQKNNDLDKSKKEFEVKNDQLEKAREHLLKLIKQSEEKRNDLEKKEKELKKLQWILEKSKYELDKNKIDFEKEKLDFDHLRSDVQLKIKEGKIEDFAEPNEDKKMTINKGKKLKGKAEFLQEILQDLTINGTFQASFLIDDKGMIVSENSNKFHDTIAIGAMFSLICTTALRTVKSLNLQELGYFKLSAVNGEFMAKSINLSNYERNLILLAYYDRNMFIDSKTKQKLTKKAVNKIMKSIKDDFIEFGEGKQISWVFENLTNRINFLKQRYMAVTKDLEQKRINLLNKISIQIKEIFES